MRTDARYLIKAIPQLSVRRLRGGNFALHGKPHAKLGRALRSWTEKVTFLSLHMRPKCDTLVVVGELEEGFSYWMTQFSFVQKIPVSERLALEPRFQGGIASIED
jgi:hypothetical protein